MKKFKLIYQRVQVLEILTDEETAQKVLDRATSGLAYFESDWKTLRATVEVREV